MTTDLQRLVRARSRRAPIGAVVLITAVLAALALAGCSKSTGANTSAGSGGSAVQAPNAANGDVAPGAKEFAQDSSGGGGVAAAPPAPGPASAPAQQVEPVDRSIIYTASLAVTVPDVNKAANDAGTAATAVGGSVSADQRTLDADRSVATLTLRVPSAAFASTVEKVAKLGTEVSRSMQTQDVTESIVDVDARITTQRASVDRVRALLAQAKTIGEVVSIESELTRREADLDSLEQRKAKLSGLVALSTITLTLRGPAAPAPPNPAPEETGFWAGLKAGWHAFLSSAKVALLVIGWLLPWVLVIGVPVWAVLLLLRRFRPRRPDPVRPLSAPSLLSPAQPSPLGAGVPGPRPAPSPSSSPSPSASASPAAESVPESSD
jgi:hypothetical protein